MKILKKVPLHTCEENLYTGALYSGCSYKILAPKKEQIDIFTSKITKVCCKNTCDAYESISFSKNSNEYFVIKENDYKNIYIIDNKYNEICKIELKVPQKYIKKIYSISFDKDSCKIYICLDNMVYSVTLQGDFIKEEIGKFALEEMKFSCIRQLNYRCCNQVNSQKIKITCASFICGILVVAYVKNNSLFISEISESGNIMETYYIDDDITVSEIFLAKGKVELLVTKQNKYNYIYITDANCSKQIKNNTCEIVHTSECRVDCQCTKPDKCTKENICDIIESIALIETAISHILNAEGEKIQKVVADATTTDELLEVNKSVQSMVNAVTRLELVLQSKLEIFAESINI